MLTFLVMMLPSVGGGLYMWESRTEYAHSRGGSSGCALWSPPIWKWHALTASWSFGAWRWRPISICTKESNRE